MASACSSIQTAIMWFPDFFCRSNTQYAQVIGQTSSAQSSCPTQMVRRSSPAPETASSSTPTPRRVQSTTDSVSSPAITEQHMRCQRRDTVLRTRFRICRKHHVPFNVSPDYDGTKRPVYVPVLRRRRHSAVVRPSYEDELH